MRDLGPPTHHLIHYRPLENAPVLRHSLSHGISRTRRFFARFPRPLRAAARLLRRLTGRQVMFRESATEQPRSDWANWNPLVFLDLLWNFAFVVVTFVVLGLSVTEKPSVPLRLWITGYCFPCVIHFSCVVAEYKQRRRRLAREPGGLECRGGGWTRVEDSNSVPLSDDYATELTNINEEEPSNRVKHIESANTLFSCLWWLLGYYWVTAGDQELIDASPQLYWLCISFLAFDILFVLICASIICLVGVVSCFCLPCILTTFYALTIQDGAAEVDIDRLPKYKFKRTGDVKKVKGDTQESLGGIMTKCDSTAPTERIVRPEDSVCCICLIAYRSGAELRELPCNHHFHCKCVDKWLLVNSTCPLCKFDILKPDSSGSEEV